MINEKFREVLNDEGVVAIVTQGENCPHMVNTWNSYITITQDGSLLIPAGFMKVTEENVKRNNHVQLTLGSKRVPGFHALGTGFLVEGIAEFQENGEHFELMKENFPWLRAVLVVKPEQITQKI